MGSETPPLILITNTLIMNITIDNKEVDLKYTFRGYMIFEQITEHSFTGVGISDFITLFYSMVMASDATLTITFDKFIEYLDTNPELLSEFSDWIGSNVSKQKELTAKKDIESNTTSDPKN